MNLLKKFIDLVLYGNFWIALCALAMCLQTTFIINQQWTGWLEAFVFFSTLFLYAVHRIIGIAKLKENFEVDRYAVIARFKQHIWIYAIIGLLLSGICFFFLNWRIQLALILPGIVSLAYVIPFLKGPKKRLRDLDDIKIFLVAIVWAWITALLPILAYAPELPYLMIGLLMLERACFVFAITLPFDIRDLKVDAFSAVRTIPARIGIRQTHLLAGLLLVMAGLFALGNYYAGLYRLVHLLAIALSLLSTYLLIYYSTPERHDYYYSGLMDGTMFLQAVLVICFSG
ncbi:MAG: hypothetical protein AAFP19_05290 [Bacteroidota bacterium]